MNLEPLPCPFCPEENDRELFPARLHPESFTPYTFSARRERMVEHYRIVRCQGCGLVRSTPILAETEMNQLYGDSVYLFAEEAPYAARTYRELLARLMARHRFHVDSLVEIGCSTGFFLEQAQALGIRHVLGFEPSHACVAHAPAPLRAHIVAAPFDPGHLAGRRYDMVASFHVIDHLRDPVGVLQTAVAGLDPGGRVLLVCHDVESLGAKLLGDRNPIFDVEHIHLFSHATISRLMRTAGLVPLEVGPLTNTYPLRYWLRLLPGRTGLSRLLPDGLGMLHISMRAGNLYALAVKPGDTPC